MAQDTYYLTNTSLPVLWATNPVNSANDFELATSAGSGSASAVSAGSGNTNTTGWVFTTPTTEPNLTTWPSGTFQVTIDIQSIDAESGVAFQLTTSPWRWNRLNAGATGFLFAWTGTSASRTTTGLFSFPVSNSQSGGGGDAGERLGLALAIQDARSHGGGTLSCTLQFNSNTIVTTPFSAGPSTQNLTGTLFTRAPTFPQGTVTRGAVALTGTLFAKAPTFIGGGKFVTAVLGTTFQRAPSFGGGTLTATYALTGTLFARAPTFFGGELETIQPLVGTTFTKAPTFFAGTFIQTVAGVTFQRAPTFAAGSLATTYALAGVTFVRAPSFAQGEVTTTAVILDGTLFAQAPTFGGGAVASSYALAGTTLTQAPTFGGGAITATYALSGQLFTKAPSFGTGTITAGTVALVGTTFTQAPSFPQGLVAQGLTLQGVLFTKAPHFDPWRYVFADPLLPPTFISPTPADEATIYDQIFGVTLAWTYPHYMADFNVKRLMGQLIKRWKFDSTIENWGNDFNASLAHDATRGAIKVTATAANAASIVSVPSLGSGDVQAHGLPVSPGDQLVAAISLRKDYVPTSGTTVLHSIAWYFYTSAGAFEAQLGANTDQAVFDDNYDMDRPGIHLSLDPITVPANAAYAVMFISAPNVPAGGEWYLDDVVVLRTDTVSLVDAGVMTWSVGAGAFTSGNSANGSSYPAGDDITDQPLDNLVESTDIPADFVVIYAVGSRIDGALIVQRSMVAGLRVYEVATALIPGTTFVKAPTFPQGTIEGDAYPLTGTLFAQAPSFGTGTITVGAVALTGTTFTQAPTFFAGTVEATYALTGTLFTRAPSFGGGVITAGQALSGITLTRAPTFGTGSITTGAVGLTGTTFTKAPSFAAGVLAAGAVALTGTTFTKAPTFGGGVVTAGQAVLGITFQRAPSFGAGQITTGTVALVGQLFVRAPSFGAGTVAATFTVTGVTLIRAPSFGTGTVDASYALVGAPFTKDPVFGGGIVLGGTVDFVLGGTFIKAPIFGTGTVLAGEVALAGITMALAPSFLAGIIFHRLVMANDQGKGTDRGRTGVTQDRGLVGATSDRGLRASTIDRGLRGYTGR